MCLAVFIAYYLEVRPESEDVYLEPGKEERRDQLND